MAAALTLRELTKPFDFIQDTIKSTRLKFLEGVPYAKKYFPGPFTNNTAKVPVYHPSLVKSLRKQARKYPFEQSGNPKCPNTGKRNRIQMVEGFKDHSYTDPSSETGFGSIVPTYRDKCHSDDNPLLDIDNRPVDHFSHNNMVPYYGSNVTQNMHATGVPQAGDNNDCEVNYSGFSNKTPFRGKLERFTGCDEMYQHKRELGPMFSPAEQQTGYVFGSPAFRPNLDEYQQTLTVRNFETPVEKIQVGPGIGLDPSVPASGGFQQFTRILPNNVSNYKANQLENRVNAGKWVYSNKPTSQYIHGVSTNRPKTVYTQARRPTMQTKFYTNAPSADSARVTDYLSTAQKGKQGRSQTEVSAGFGELDMSDVQKPCVNYSSAPIGKTMGALVPNQTQDRGSYTYIREPFKKGTMSCPDLPQGSYRWDLWQGVKNSVPNDTTRDGWFVNYTDRGQKNPFVINVSGSAVWNPNSYQDQQKVTRRETTEYAYQGNPGGSIPNTTEQQFTDLPKVTRKETTYYGYQGNPAKQITNSTEQKFSDLPKVTRRETTEFSYLGSPQQAGVAQSDRFMYTGNYV
jgi:hypothetical protein